MNCPRAVSNEPKIEAFSGGSPQTGANCGPFGPRTLARHEPLRPKKGCRRKSLSWMQADARMIEAAYQEKLGETALARAAATVDRPQADATLYGNSGAATTDLAFPKEPVRKRSKARLSFVRGQPCLICKQTPSDPHHLKSAQPRASRRKVSDEFTVPLCRTHHQDLHRQGRNFGKQARSTLKQAPQRLSISLKALVPGASPCESRFN
jgi:hypothetical protein